MSEAAQDEIIVASDTPEVYTPDDTLDFTFLGASYCAVNANSTGSSGSATRRRRLTTSE